ncbi:unnamed protein product [Tilletia laevis]|uniref:Major facilitator superfamily (MFS) profile domain-containing protein n=2 Tax=Tilletia TaxID=13289 RepID=A0A9N8LNU1_9BASI|nr:hypothetical protein CF336_g3955 [Tilletia laevis]CAD6889661.1 unnamed protein product [Tilletia caries]CAD6915044.1 unnamed protein product [Tilletia controversa]KAE8201964.1 hypothetical protein CF335_g3592 [Tilletia laevis]CAD6909026.1 unnamed protein product [Tilletia caries]
MNRTTPIDLEQSPSVLDAAGTSATNSEEEERKLPPIAQLAIIVSMNLFLNVSFFIIVPSAPAYATSLGASTWFSGLCIGISTAAAGLVLYPVSRRYSLAYKTPMSASCVCFVVGNIIYALAGVANTAWLMAVGRVIGGLGNISWMLVKRYITDSRLVGTRRRTMLSAWLVTSQVLGMAIGPFSGGLLTKIGGVRQAGKVWNGFTSASWIMAIAWATFLVVLTLVFKDPPGSDPSTTLLEDLHRLAGRISKLPPNSMDIELKVDVKAVGKSRTAVSEHIYRATSSGQDDRITALAPSTPPALPSDDPKGQENLNAAQWASLGMMCWFAMVTFFTLGAWEANIPVFSSIFPGLNWTEEKAGNILALAAIVILPILFALVFLSKYIQDRVILATGIAIGLSGLVIHMVTLTPGLEHSINLPSFFASWLLVALGYNMMSTVTLSLLSKQVPPHFNNYTSLIIQLSNYSGRLGGAFWGTAVEQVGQRAILSLELALVLFGTVGTVILWKKMYASKG